METLTRQTSALSGPRSAIAAGLALLFLMSAPEGVAHHSFAMYDHDRIHILTGVVTRVDPNPNHLQLFVAPLDAAREQVLRDTDGELIQWAIEMDGAAAAARDGISVNGFPRGTVVSVGLYPLRNGFPAGGRGEFGLYKCPPETAPEPGAHCDSVAGATTHGDGELPTDTTGPLPDPVKAD